MSGTYYPELPVDSVSVIQSIQAAVLPSYSTGTKFSTSTGGGGAAALSIIPVSAPGSTDCITKFQYLPAVARRTRFRPSEARSQSQRRRLGPS